MARIGNPLTSGTTVMGTILLAAGAYMMFGFGGISGGIIGFLGLWYGLKTISNGAKKGGTPK